MNSTVESQQDYDAVLKSLHTSISFLTQQINQLKQEQLIMKQEYNQMLPIKMLMIKYKEINEMPDGADKVVAIKSYNNILQLIQIMWENQNTDIPLFAKELFNNTVIHFDKRIKLNKLAYDINEYEKKIYSAKLAAYKIATNKANAYKTEVAHILLSLSIPNDIQVIHTEQNHNHSTVTQDVYDIDDNIYDSVTDYPSSDKNSDYEDDTFLQENKRLEKQREYNREYNREYRTKNRDKILKYHREYNREYRTKNRDKNLEKERERLRKYRAKNRDKLLEKERERFRKYRAKNRDKLLEKKK
jgi:hypothetical protein